MSFLQQTYKGKTDWWRWLIVLILFFTPFLANFFKIVFIKPLSTILPKSKNTDFALALFVSVFLLLIFIILFKFIHKRSFLTLITSRNKFDWFRFLFSFASWGVITMIALIISVYFEPKDYVWNFKLLPFIVLLLISILLIPIQVFFTEVLIRGYLFQTVTYFFKRPWLSLLVTILVTVCLTHSANKSMLNIVGFEIIIYYFVVNLTLGIIVVLDNGLEMSLGVKMVNNLIFTLFTTSKINSIQTDSVLYNKTGSILFLIVYSSIFIGFPLYFYFLKRIYKWPDWRVKLFNKVEK